MKKTILSVLLALSFSGTFAKEIIHIRSKNNSELEQKYSRILMECFEEQGILSFYDNEQTEYFYQPKPKSFSKDNYYYCIVDNSADANEKGKYICETYGFEKVADKKKSKEFKDLGLSFDEQKTILYFKTPERITFFGEEEGIIRFFYNKTQETINERGISNWYSYIPLPATDDEAMLKSFFTKTILRDGKKTETQVVLPYLDSLHIKTTFYGVAATEDHRCVVSKPRELLELGPYGEIRKNLLKEIPEDDQKLSDFNKTMTIPYFTKNGDLVLGTLSGENAVYHFSNEGNYKGFTLYNPSEAFNTNMEFRSNGVPFRYDSLYSDDLHTISSLEDLLEESAISEPSGCHPCPLGGFYYYDRNRYVLYKLDDDLNITSIIPVDYTFGYSTWGIQKVFEDGSFYIRNNGSNIFSADGEYLYTIKNDTDIPASIKNGIVHCANGSRYIYDESQIPEDLRTIGKNNRLINDNIIRNSRCLYENAVISMNHGAYDYAEQYLEKYLIYNAGDNTAKEMALKLKVRREKEECSVLTEQAISLFDYYGRENGYEAYHKAMLILEQLVKQVPNDMEILEMYSELQKRFSPEMKISNKVPELKIQEVALSSIFPVLSNVYAENPAGFISVKNTGETSAKNISVKAFIRNYMDFASESPAVPELKSGEVTSLEIKLLFNNKILNVNENRQVQVQYIISWDQAGEHQTMTLVRPAMIYKKTAMTWEDTRMLSCFIHQDDPTVQKFAFSVMDQKTDASNFITKNFLSAMKLADALGTLPVNYVSDPVSPVTMIMDNPYAIDTVRFAKDTLNYRGGDCDDITVLYCSLLESIGIPSAVITIPGHIFAAFNANFKYNSIWENMKEKYTVIEQDGETWIPVEITVLESGFKTAWETASKEIRDAEQKNDEIEFIPISEARIAYPSVSYEDQMQKDIMIGHDASLLSEDLRILKEEVFVPNLKEMHKKKDAATMNLIAKFYFSMDCIEDAISILEEAYKSNPENVKIVKNLESLYKLTNESEKLAKLEKSSKKLKKGVVQSKTNKMTRAEDKAMDFEWEE